MKQSEKVYTGSLNTLKPALNLLAAFALLTLTACGGGGGGGGSAPVAHNIAQQAYLKASNAEEFDGFGTSVALDGDTLVVGASSEDGADNGRENGTGAVYVFTRDNAGEWVEQTILRAGNARAGDNLGSSLVLEGDTLVVGASGQDGGANNSGAVYVFTRDSNGDWTEQAMLKAGNTRADDRFGDSVALDGDTLVVGAIGQDGRATDSGAVYVFTRDVDGVWSQQAMLKAGNAGADDHFGENLALSDDTLVVGAIGEDGDDSGNEDDSGAAYVFTRDSAGEWIQQTILKISNARVRDNFGCSLALEGDMLVVGSRHEDSIASNSGAAYVFTRDNAGDWSQQVVLKASNAGNDDKFGSRVALSNGTLVVSAPFKNGGESGNERDSGAVYVFTGSGANWTEQAILKAGNTGEFDYFGHSVALSGDTVAVGAHFEDGDANSTADNPNDNATYAGAVYVFQ